MLDAEGESGHWPGPLLLSSSLIESHYTTQTQALVAVVQTDSFITGPRKQLLIS